MRTPTAEDVLAACEIARLYWDVMLERGMDTEEDMIPRDAYRAERVIHTWLDQFDAPTDKEVRDAVRS